MSRKGRPLPMSFEARGASVPFESTSLRECRLRVVDLGRELDWEITVPSGMGGTDSRSVMILPWRDVPAFAGMTLRDKELYQRIDDIDDSESPDPFKVREIRIRVDQTMGETEEVRQQAALEVDREKQDRLMTYLSFLAQLTRDCGIRKGDAFMASADTALLMRLTKDKEASKEAGLDASALTERVLSFASEELDAPVKVVNKRLEELTSYMAPFGAVNIEAENKTDGFLTRTRNEIKRMDRTMTQYSKTARTETSDRITLVRFAIKDFLDYVDDRFNQIEQFFSYFMNVFREYDKTKGFAQQIRRDVSYALDGWSHLCRIWFTALDSKEGETIDDAIGYILANLPIMPDEEVNQNDDRSKVRRGFEMARVQMVRTMVNWTDNTVDKELEQRVAAAKEEQAKPKVDPNQVKKRRRAGARM
ncbi:hypothetical protein [Thalassobaculum litoreum]|uniref:Uncharacterized protein n=1 Tax=Thalassobaculum litoreum DSM 18839 TaxID=1123362 RepID=A0A8G2EWH7_9PROT|nr:hypothetical protein [Thalassobaculum litoreum]SDG30898.1 hypothetical protein SAMN05660686_03978 [Thalassobaculum litoreum DSM 18839]